MNDNTQVVNEQPQEVNELEIDAVFRPISPDQSIVPDTPPQPKQPEPLQHDVTLAPYKKTHTLYAEFDAWIGNDQHPRTLEDILAIT